MSRPWWQATSVYQVYLRSLQDSDGDGVGDLPGVLRRLDDLAELGVQTLWLSPVHPSPDVDYGYDVADYLGVHPAFGSHGDLDGVIAGARDRGMRVLLDGVFNHSSDQHAWFQSSRSDPTGPHGDWYHWHAGDRPPNNWKSTFGGPAWSRDAVRGDWYLHSFAPQQPDLNWARQPVADAVIDSMAHWLGRGISGFRLDVFNCYCKAPGLPSNPRRWHPAGLVYGFIGQHHLFDRDQPALAGVLQRMRTLADAHDAVLIGETLDERFRYDNAAQWVGADRLHLAFHFRLLHSRWGAAAFARAITAWQGELGPEGWPTWVVGNHDFPRVASRWGARDGRVTEERMGLVALLVCGLRGTPFVYQGDELGLREARLARREIVDPPGVRFWPFFKGRDGCRTPMLWEPEGAGGFTTGAPWLPMSGEPERQAWSVQRERAGSVWRTWQAALRGRAELAVVNEGAQGAVQCQGSVLRWTRSLGEEAVEVVLNLGDRSVSVGAGGEVLLGTHEDPAADGVLRAREGVWRRAG